MNMQNLKPNIVFSPGEILLDELEERNISQSDFAEILNRPLKTINEIIKGKKSITPETANDIAAALGTSPELWLGLQAEYDLFKISHSKKDNNEEVKNRAELYAHFPVKELRKREYISNTKHIAETRKEIFTLFSLTDILQWKKDCLVNFANFKKSSRGDINENYINAWIELGKKIAKETKIVPFNKKGLIDFTHEIKSFSQKDDGIKNIVNELGKLGVKLIFLPHFSKTRVDGATFWIDKTPVILMSLRYDRIDNFYFTLLHEVGHIILHGDNEYKNFFDDTMTIGDSTDKREIEANKFAQDELTPQGVIGSFAGIRPGAVPFNIISEKSKEANIHRGILIGVLQHKKLLSYGQYRVALAKIKDKIPAGLIQK
jgi:HTH-type transcriptional regulator / antitoxin HigA